MRLKYLALEIGNSNLSGVPIIYLVSCGNVALLSAKVVYYFSIIFNFSTPILIETADQSRDYFKAEIIFLVVLTSTNGGTHGNIIL